MIFLLDADKLSLQRCKQRADSGEAAFAAHAYHTSWSLFVPAFAL